MIYYKVGTRKEIRKRKDGLINYHEDEALASKSHSLEDVNIANMEVVSLKM